MIAATGHYFRFRLGRKGERIRYKASLISVAGTVNGFVFVVAFHPTVSKWIHSALGESLVLMMSQSRKRRYVSWEVRMMSKELGTPEAGLWTITFNLTKEHQWQRESM